MNEDRENNRANDRVNPRFEALLDHLKRNRGFDFTAYKRSSLQRRVEKRMQAVNISKFDGYLNYLEVHPDEFDALFDTILINVTEFFRDMPVWEELASDVIPQIIRSKMRSDHIRVWSAGCATGEEAYTVGMVFSEALGVEQARDRVKIYATDADENALKTARLGVYPAKGVQTVPPSLLAKYFTQDGDRYSVHRELRRAVIFGRHDLIQDPPLSRVDLLLCRNTLMYFNNESQSKVLARFHLALNDGGYLVAGRAEMLLTHGHIFTPVDLKRRVFQKVMREGLPDRVSMLVCANNRNNDDDLERLVLSVAFENAPTAQLVLDPDGRIVALNQRARQLLKLDAKDAGRPVPEIGATMWPLEIQRAINHAYTYLLPSELRDVEWPDQSGQTRYFGVTVSPWKGKDGVPAGVSVAFDDVTAYRALYEQLQRSRQELETMSEELQSSNEELETTNEELQSTVEELETTNEELQSTNEELETMNEELQSTNEELHTTNDQLQTRGEEINSASAFFQTVLSSLPHGLAVLDKEGHVINWNAQAEDLWGLRPGDVRGKPFLSLDIGLPLDQLVRPVRQCLAGERGQVTVPAINRRGKQVTVTVECTPVNRTGQGFDGAIILMSVGEKRE